MANENTFSCDNAEPHPILSKDSETLSETDGNDAIYGYISVMAPSRFPTRHFLYKPHGLTVDSLIDTAQDADAGKLAVGHDYESAYHSLRFVNPDSAVAVPVYI